MKKRKSSKKVKTGFLVYQLGNQPYKVYVTAKAVREFGAPKGPKGQSLKLNRG